MDIQLNDALKIVEIVSILGGGGMVAYKLGRATSRFEESLKLQAEEIQELKEETKKMGAVLSVVAVQDNRLNRIEEDMRELRHGKGWVNPLSG